MKRWVSELFGKSEDGINFSTRGEGWKNYYIRRGHRVVGWGKLVTWPSDAHNALFAELIMESYAPDRERRVIASVEDGYDGPTIALMLSDDLLATDALKRALETSI